MKNKRERLSASNSAPLISGRSSLDILPAFRKWVLQTPGIYLLVRHEDLIIDLVNSSLLVNWHKDPSIVGHALCDVFPEFQGQQLLQNIQAVYDTAIPIFRDPEQVLTRRAGINAFSFYRYACLPVFGEDGRLWGVCISGFEVSGKDLLPDATLNLNG